MPRERSRTPQIPATPAAPGHSPGAPSGNAPRGNFVARQEGQRFNAPLNSIALSPRNLREEWEYETDEFAEFTENIRGSKELIQDPAVASVANFVKKYPEHAAAFGEPIEWVLIAGERRLMATKALAGDDESAVLPVVLRDRLLKLGDFALLSENTYRKGWDPIQEALLIQRIKTEEGLTYDQILKRLGGDMRLTKTDISKRMKLLTLQDGPLRRAIRMRAIGAEAAYHLITQLKNPALIEKGWELMQEQEVTAKVACELLLKPAKPELSVTDALPAGHNAADAQDDDPSFAGETPTPTTAPAGNGPAAQDADDDPSFAGETPTPVTPVVPGQTGRGSMDGSASSATGHGTSAGTAGGVDGEVVLRVEACQQMLEALPRMGGHLAQRLAAYALLDARSEVIELAATLSKLPVPAGDGRAEYVGRLLASPDDGLFKLAFATALASAELRLREGSGSGDPLARSYLDLLQGQDDESSEPQANPIEVSPTKL